MFGDAKLQHDNLQKNNLLLDIEANSNSVSIRANTAVFNNVYYFECQILTGGSMLIGWSSMSSVFRVNEGVGDEKNSYGYDVTGCGLEVKPSAKSSMSFARSAWDAHLCKGSRPKAHS